VRVFWLLLLAAAGGLGYAYFTILERVPPTISTRTDAVYVGQSHAHEFQVSDEGRGVQSIRVWLEAAGQTKELYAETFDGTLLGGAQPAIARRVEVKVEPKVLGLESGEAVLHAEATDFAWSGNVAAVAVPLVIDPRPPRVSVRTGLTYVRKGGSELAVYEIDEATEKHGVLVGERLFPGFPNPAQKNSYVSFYAIPPYKELAARPAVFAEDRAGNTTKVPLSVNIMEGNFKTDVINLSDAFLQAKVAELLGGDKPDPLAAYLEINNEMRKQNDAQIVEICKKSSEERLWSGPFLQLPNSKVGATFAQRRSYVYNGKEVDKQIHLGFDMASNSRAEVPAGNDGVVAHATELGIYGKTVILDHGLGLFSLYSHLSEISVEKGQAIARGEVLGRSGDTGLAGGDHLHFSMMLNGEFINPIEWLDPKWINDHIEAKLKQPEATPPTEGSASGSAQGVPANAANN
jgi:murein DD-endopeptidase MepM/ murein hydrolase activator NlpD